MRKVVRENDARTARINPQNAIGEGSFKVVFSGEYVDGDRHGQPCVAKSMRDPRAPTKAFDKELEIIQKARELIKKFNDAKIIVKRIVLNIPEVWEDEHQRRVLVEPYLKHFENFNSNTGHVSESETPWARVMQALSHFSYHVSSGQFLLCDLQGAVYRNELVLTDPVVLSRNGRFGPTDLGSEGMENFFHWHTCTDYCHPNWQVPKKARYYHQPRLGTSMTDGRNFIVPTRSTPSIPSLHAATQHTVSSSAGTLEQGLVTDLEPDTPSWLVRKSFDAVFSDDKRPDTVDYRPGRVSQADAKPWLTGISQATAPSAEPLHFSDTMRIGSLTEPAPTRGAQHADFDPFIPRPSAATEPAHPQAAYAQGDLQHEMLADMGALPTDPQLPTDFTEEAPGQMHAQDPTSLLDMLQKGEQFVQQASATGIISDPGELARDFMRPQPAVTRTHTSRFMHRSQEHAATGNALSDSATVLGVAVVNILSSLLRKPSYTADEIAQIQELDSLILELTSLSQQLSAKVHHLQSSHHATTPELAAQSRGQSETPAGSAHMTSQSYLSREADVATLPSSSRPEQYPETSSRVVGPQHSPVQPPVQQAQQPSPDVERRAPSTIAQVPQVSSQQQVVQLQQEIAELTARLQPLQVQRPSVGVSIRDQPAHLSRQEDLPAASVQTTVQSQLPQGSHVAAQSSAPQAQQHVATTSRVLEPQDASVVPPGQQVQQSVPACSLRTPAGSQPDSSAQPTTSHAPNTAPSEQEQHLPVSEILASPSSVATSEFSVSRAADQKEQLPGISELTEGDDDLTDAELAAAMRAVLRVRKQQVRR